MINGILLLQDPFRALLCLVVIPFWVRVAVVVVEPKTCLCRSRMEGQVSVVPREPPSKSETRANMHGHNVNGHNTSLSGLTYQVLGGKIHVLE